MTEKSASVLLRISQDTSQDARSLDTQRADAQRTCRSHGLHYGEEYSDTASASEYGAARGAVRDSFARLLEDIDAGRAGRVLIVASVSRTARDIEVLENLRKRLARAGMKWCIGGRMMDPAEPGDTMLILMEGIQAQVTAHTMSKDIRRGVREARAAGRAPAGRTPFGFYRPPRETGQRVRQVHHETNASLLRWAITEAIPSGLSLGRVASRWGEDGVPARTWTRAEVRRALLNPVNIGMTKHYGDLLRAEWEPIVTVEEFDRCREILSQSSRRKTDFYQSTTLLSSIATHRGCGLKIGVKRQGGPHYRCACGRGVWLRVDAIDARVTLAVFDEVHRATARAAERGRFRRAVDTREIAEAELQRAEAEYNDLKDHWHDHGLTLAEYASAVRPLRTAVAHAKAAVARVEPAPEPVVLDARLYPALWNQMTLDEQRAQIRHWLTVSLDRDGLHTESNGR